MLCFPVSMFYVVWYERDRLRMYITDPLGINKTNVLCYRLDRMESVMKSIECYMEMHMISAVRDIYMMDEIANSPSWFPTVYERVHAKMIRTIADLEHHFPMRYTEIH